MKTVDVSIVPEELSAAELVDLEEDELEEDDVVEVAPAPKSGDLSVFDALEERRPVTQAPRAVPVAPLAPVPAVALVPSFTATSVGIASPIPAPASAPTTMLGLAPPPAVEPGTDTVVLVRAEMPEALNATPAAPPVATPVAASVAPQPTAPAAARTTQPTQPSSAAAAQPARAQLTSLVDDDLPGDTLILPSSELQAAQNVRPAAGAPLALAPTQAAHRPSASMLVAPPPHCPMPSSASMPIAAPRGPHGSIAPMALDVRPSVHGTVPMQAMSAAQARAVAPRRAPVLLLAGVAFTLAFVGAVAGAIALGGRQEPSRAAASRPAPRVVEIARATSGSLEEPATAPAKDPALASADPEPAPSTTTSSLADRVEGRPAPAANPAPRAPAASPAPVAKPAASAASPAPAPAPKVASKPAPTTAPAPTSPAPQAAPPPAPPPPPPAARAPAPVATTGTVLVDPELKTITIDGDYARVTGGRVVVPCGRHRIGAGLGGARIVEVPCGGTVSLR